MAGSCESQLTSEALILISSAGLCGPLRLVTVSAINRREIRGLRRESRKNNFELRTTQ